MGRGLLIIVSGLFIIFGIIQRSLSERRGSITRGSANYATNTQSEVIANSMADLAFAQINKHPGEDVDDFEDLDILGGEGSAQIQTVYPFAPSNPFVERKIINAAGKFNGKEVGVKVVAQRRAFSTYSYFSVEEPLIYFVDSDILNGPVHTNGVFHFKNEPVFNGKITSPNDWVGWGGGQNANPKFNGGSDFDFNVVDLPIEVPELAQEANNGGLRFSNPVDLTFYNKEVAGSDVGKVRIKECTGSYNNSSKTCSEWSPSTDYNLDNYNGIISTDQFAQMKGIINGNYTVHSKRDIKIMGDLTYFDNPLTHEEGDPASNDFLGIVSEDQIIIDKNAHKYDYNGADLNDYTYDDSNKDIDIQGSIMALGENKSFTVEDYDQGDPRGVINLYGGLIQYERGAVGKFNGGGVTSGYFKNYSYDERFLGQAPRGFPRSDVYDYISWETDYE